MNEDGNLYDFHSYADIGRSCHLREGERVVGNGESRISIIYRRFIKG